MRGKAINLKPVKKLLSLHTQHTTSYHQNFMGLNLVIHPKVFNPAFTNVTRLLAENLQVKQNAYILDMFCGSGVLGLLVSNSSERLVGVDISSKAVLCARFNAKKMGISNKAEFRQANLWQGLKAEEQFDLIIANPPLLPVIPESELEMTVADSPVMDTTLRFVAGCRQHLKENGRALMAFSNACKVIFGDPFHYISLLAKDSGLSVKVIDKKDVGYEIYRILEFKKIKMWQK